uniref:Uncharacterized protein n=1 Tax=Romanomermis culicivorax TaxID=13658 RepID=A0A915JXW1_ROMCU
MLSPPWLRPRLGDIWQEVRINKAQSSMPHLNACRTGPKPDFLEIWDAELDGDTSSQRIFITMNITFYVYLAATRQLDFVEHLKFRLLSSSKNGQFLKQNMGVKWV